MPPCWVNKAKLQFNLFQHWEAGVASSWGTCSSPNTPGPRQAIGACLGTPPQRGLELNKASIPGPGQPLSTLVAVLCLSTVVAGRREVVNAKLRHRWSARDPGEVLSPVSCPFHGCPPYRDVSSVIAPASNPGGTPATLSPALVCQSENRGRPDHTLRRCPCIH